MEYHSASKKKETLSYPTIWMNLEDIMLSEVSESQKDTCCVIWPEVSKVVKLKEAESLKVVSKGCEEGEMSCSVGIKFQSYKMSKFYISDVQHSACI